MEHVEIVPKSLGCFPHKSLSKLRINSFRSSKSSSSNLSSPTSPKSPNITTPQLFSPKRKTSSTSSSTREDVLQQVFGRFDGDNDGKISAVELRSYFGSIGEYMSHEEAQLVIADNDTDGDNLIDFQDFVRLMRTKDEGDEEDLKAAFGAFELERGSGRITPKSLQRVLSRLGDSKTYDDCVTMIESFDRDGNGELDFHEFHQMMMA